jgi:hypothetical protein
MQALTRNPLADPGLLGVSLGAATGVVVAIAFLGVAAPLGYVWFALGGAALTSVVVFLLGSAGRSPATPDRLVVAGAATTAVLYAFNSAVLLLNPKAFDQFRFWNVGALSGRYYDIVQLTWQPIAVRHLARPPAGRQLVGPHQPGDLGLQLRQAQHPGISEALDRPTLRSATAHCAPSVMRRSSSRFNCSIRERRSSSDNSATSAFPSSAPGPAATGASPTARRSISAATWRYRSRSDAVARITHANCRDHRPTSARDLSNSRATFVILRAGPRSRYTANASNAWADSPPLCRSGLPPLARSGLVLQPYSSRTSPLLMVSVFVSRLSG